MNSKKVVAAILSATLLLSGCGGKGSDDPAGLLKSGKYEEASEAYIKLIDKDEKNIEAYNGLADAYVGMKEYEAAVDVLSECYGITGNKELVKKMNSITDKLYKTSKDKVGLQTVIYCCERILECGADAKLYEMIAMSYVKMEQYDKAIETVTVAVEETEDEGIAEKIASELYTIGSKAYTDGKKDDAKECLGYILEIDPDNKKATDLLNAINGVKEDKKDEKEDKKKEEKTDVKKDEPSTPEPVKPEPVKPQPVTPEPVNPEPPVPETPAVAEPSGSYTVQIGAYGELANAENKVAAANAAGLSASYFSSGGLYRVTIGTYSSESEANAAVARAQAAGFSAVII